MKVIQAGVEIGRVLSGGYSPSIQVPIGTVWTSRDYSSQLSSEVEVRGQPVEIKYCKPVLRELRKQK
jgi:glycine cleavage system aminomethyltransferase T